MKHYRLFLVVFSFLLFFVLNTTLQAQEEQPTPAALPKITDTYTYKTIPGAQGTFGYDIYAGKKIVIHQPTIPAMQGTEGFMTKMAAEKVAQLVIEKLKKGQMPPTVNISEMKKLKAIP